MLREPAPSTLAKYGLTLEEWLDFLPVNEDGERYCPVCGKVPPSGRFVTDHEHVARWKHMPPEERKKYVRGVVCVTDNHYVLSRYLTVEKALGAAEYLRNYRGRREASSQDRGARGASLGEA